MVAIRTERLCRNGHDLSVFGCLPTGRCRECKRGNNARYYQRHRPVVRAQQARHHIAIRSTRLPQMARYKATPAGQLSEAKHYVRREIGRKVDRIAELEARLAG